MIKKRVKKLVLREVRIPLNPNAQKFDYDKAAIFEAVKKIKRTCGKIDCNENSFAVFKKSVDARKKEEISFVYSVIFELNEEIFLDEKKYDDFLNYCRKHSLTILDDSQLILDTSKTCRRTRPVVVGFGPCGIFLSLILAQAGFCPVVIERGSDVDTRAEKVDSYWKGGALDTETNVQFGEGGAGTFSDGKLMTRINDKLCSYVLEVFYRHGANHDILVNAKPHVGTDKLRAVVKNIRKTIISLGGEIYFNTCLTGIRRHSDGSVCGAVTSNGEIETDSVFLAVGHSARDTFKMLAETGVELCAKPFSVGVRIEHLQENINRSLYGKNYDNPALPQGEYSLSRRFGEHAVYSFCMCPGGTVVASASEKDTIVTNGMSYSCRNGINANSAIAVSVNQTDLQGGLFAGMQFQEDIERAAYRLAGSAGAAPIENLGHFLGHSKLEIKDVKPSYTGKTELCDISSLFPHNISKLLGEGITFFERQINGFSTDSAILTAPETRTSSPVRILRNEYFESVVCKGLYPCGEGAGYAGGITSAAVDGIRCALAFIEKCRLI